MIAPGCIGVSPLVNRSVTRAVGESDSLPAEGKIAIIETAELKPEVALHPVLKLVRTTSDMHHESTKIRSGKKQESGNHGNVGGRVKVCHSGTSQSVPPRGRGSLGFLGAEVQGFVGVLCRVRMAA